MKSLKHWGLALVALCVGVTSHAQLCTVNGVVEDALTGDPLIGAYVKSGNAVVATDYDGVFSMAVPKGEALIEVSYIGYESESRQVTCEGAGTSVRFRMETLIMKEAVVSADLVISVSYTHLTLPTKA